MVYGRDATIDIPLTPLDSPQHMVSRQLDSSQSGDYLKERMYETNYSEKGMEKQSTWTRHHAGRRRAKKQEANVVRTGHDGEEEILNRMGRFYNKILNFSIVTRYFLYVLPLAILIAVPIIIGATAAPKASIDNVRIVWFFTWLEIVWLSLWVSKLFAQIMPRIFQFLCGIVSSGTRKYALVLKKLELPLSLSGWALASLATFKPLMTRNPDVLRQNKLKATIGVPHWQSVVNSILAALLVASLIFLAQKFLVQMISINYHRKQFNARIKKSKRNIHLLSLLYDASRTLFPAYCPEFAEEDYIINDSITLTSSSKASHNRSGAATPMRLIQNVGRVGDKLTSAFGNIAQELTGKEVFNPNSAHSIVVEALEKKQSSEALAKRLWMSFVVEGKESLYQEDIVEVLGAQRSTEAEECFDALDRDGNGDVSLDEMIMTVVEFGRERHSVASSMADVDQAIHVLDQLLGTIVFVIIIFVFVGFLNASFTTTLATAGTALLSLSFVFAATAQEVLGSCIFLFVKHPYDVGDRVDITDQPLTVEHISLLFTVFRRVDTHKTVQIPNIVLNTVWIENITRSKAMRERVSMFIHFDTTLEDIQALRSEIQAFVADKENNRDFQPDIDVEVVGIAEMNKLELRVEIRHKSNWANETLRAARRSKFMCALVLALRKVPIYGPGAGDAALGDFGKPSYSVAISDAEAKEARKKFLDDKEAKRLYPSALKPADKHSPSSSFDGGKNLDSLSFAQVSSNDWAPTSDSQNKLSQRTRAAEVQQEETRPTTAAPSERTAVGTLNSRHPMAEAGRDDWESYRDGMATNSNVKRTSADTHRTNDLEEMRGMLRRESTRGRRKHGMAPQIPLTQAEPVSPISLQTAQFPAAPSSTSYGYAPPAASTQQNYYPPQRKESLSRKQAQQQQQQAQMQPPVQAYVPAHAPLHAEPPPRALPMQVPTAAALQAMQSKDRSGERELPRRPGPSPPPPAAGSPGVANAARGVGQQQPAVAGNGSSSSRGQFGNGPYTQPPHPGSPVVLASQQQQQPRR